jgi:hypothetical protein
MRESLVGFALVVTLAATAFSSGIGQAGEDPEAVTCTALPPIPDEFIVLGNMSGEVWCFPVVSGSIAPGECIHRFVQAAVGGLAILDCDSDNDLDIVAMVLPIDSTGELIGDTDLYSFENIDSAFIISPLPESLPPSGGFGFAMSDIVAQNFSGDSRYDLLVSINGTPGTRLYLFEHDSASGAFAQVFLGQTSWANHAWTLDAGDAQSDSCQDFVIFDYPSSSDFSDEVYLYSGDCARGFTPSFACSTIHSCNDIAVADFNGDSCADLVIGVDDDGNPGGVWLYLGDNSGSFTLASTTAVFDLDTLHNSGSDHYTGGGHLDACDVDRDGNMDVIAFVYGTDGRPFEPTLWLVYGNGDGTFDPPALIDKAIGDTAIPLAIAVPVDLPTTSVRADGQARVPEALFLLQNHPNPTSSIAVIEYALPKECHTTLKLYDVTGRELTTIVDEREKPGLKRAKVDTRNMVSGVYFYRLQTSDHCLTRKMMVLR